MFGQRIPWQLSLAMFVMSALALIGIMTTVSCSRDKKEGPRGETKVETPSYVASTGPVIVQYAWHNVGENGENTGETGQYQFRSMTGETTVLQFCEPIPVFDKNQSLGNVRYDTRADERKNCVKFISAQQ